MKYAYSQSKRVSSPFQAPALKLITSPKMQRPAHLADIQEEGRVRLGFNGKLGDDGHTFSSLLAGWDAVITRLGEAGFPSSS